MTNGIEDNYIVLDPKGNTYYGSLATRCATNGQGRELERMFSLDLMITHPAGQFWCVEVMADGSLITRAGQSTIRGANRFMAPGRMLVWHSALENVRDARELVCHIRP